MLKYIVSIFVYILVSVNINAAISFTGNELLIEVVNNKFSRKTPGIYAFDIDRGIISLVVADGHKPKWSYDRKAFLYWSDDDLYIYDIQKCKSMVLDNMRYSQVSTTKQAWWTIDNKNIIFLAFDRPYPTYSTWLAPICDADYDNTSRLWKNTVVEQIGNLDISQALNMMAYEEVCIIPEAGKQLTSKLFVVSMEDNKGKDIADIRKALCCPNMEGKVLFNPKWQPGGSLLSFESINLSDSTCEIWFWDYHMDKYYKLDIKNRCPDPFLRKERIRGGRILCWSPTGDSVLMIPYPEDYNYMLTGISPDIIPLNPVNPEEKAIHLGGPGGAIWDSCWSNRGDGIAVIRSKYLYESTYSSSTLWVWKKDNNGKWQNGYEVTLDKTQVPVSLSW